MKQLKFVPDLLTGRLGEDDAKRYFSRFGWFAFAFSLIVNAASSVLVILIQTLAPNWLYSFWVDELLSVVPIYVIAFPLAYLILAPLPTVSPVREKMRVPDFLCAFCICEAMMLVGNYISNIVLMMFSNILGGISATNPVASAVASQPMWATVLFTVILAPVLEEIFFRRLV